MRLFNALTLRSVLLRGIDLILINTLRYSLMSMSVPSEWLKVYDQLNKFFYPESVAIVGASSTPGKIGYEIFKNSIAEFKGRVYPVNPRAKEVLGFKAYPTVLDIPGKVDLAVIAIPAKVVPRVVEECGLKGVRNIVIISGGFKEVGGEGVKLEEEIVEIARRHGIRIIGPNCIGVFNSSNMFETFFQPRDRMIRSKEGKIAIVTQSGTIGAAFLEWAAMDGVGVSKLISFGNKCDVNEVDLLKYLALDDETKVIAFYLESLEVGREFLEVARRVVLKKPIVAFKGGKTSKSSKAVTSHTGRLAGKIEVLRGAFKQCGVIEARELINLYDMAKALALQPPAEGNRVCMVTNGAGGCIIAIDVFSEHGVELAELSEDTRRKLEESLPQYAIISNPVDLTGSATTSDFKAALEVLFQASEVDLVMPFYVLQDAPLGLDIIEVTAAIAKKHAKPIVCCMPGGPIVQEKARKLTRLGVPTYQTPESAALAAYALIAYGENVKRVSKILELLEDRS